MAKDGRPPAIISEKQFIAMCQVQCTQEEICDILDVSDKTLTKWCKDTFNMSFSEVFRQKRQGGKASLRRMQWKNAENGNATMQIFLGKNYLGQSDKPEGSPEENSISVTYKRIEKQVINNG